MDNPYATGEVALPPPPPSRRALWSAVLGCVLCLLAWLSLPMYGLGRLTEPVPPRTAQLQTLWDHTIHFTLAAAALCIVLGVFRVRTNKIQWIRRATIWGLVASAWVLADHTIDAIRLQVAA